MSTKPPSTIGLSASYASRDPCWMDLPTSCYCPRNAPAPLHFAEQSPPHLILLSEEYKFRTNVVRQGLDAVWGTLHAERKKEARRQDELQNPAPTRSGKAKAAEHGGSALCQAERDASCEHRVTNLNYDEVLGECCVDPNVGQPRGLRLSAAQQRLSRRTGSWGAGRRGQTAPSRQTTPSSQLAKPSILPSGEIITFASGCRFDRPTDILTSDSPRTVTLKSGETITFSRGWRRDVLAAVKSITLACGKTIYLTKGWGLEIGIVANERHKESERLLKKHNKGL
ncbi:hypothetical protein DL769_010765 [Monosporascus sp. CRB-8-3]|nr:hypothetical protein DL769_010765 [Monosporascus sp. CRB-8-3]